MDLKRRSGLRSKLRIIIGPNLKVRKPLTGSPLKKGSIVRSQRR